MTNLIEAVCLCRVAGLRGRLKAGDDINERDNAGRTALMHAAQSDRRKVQLRILLAAGAQLDLQDNTGKTALMHAAPGAPNNVEALIKAGARADIADNAGRSAKAMAQPDSFCLLNAAEVSQAKGLGSVEKSLAPAGSQDEQHGQSEAEQEELPEVLRYGGWPVIAASRTPVVVGKVILPERLGRLVWKDDEQKRILATHRIKQDAESDSKFEEAISRFERKPFTVEFGTLINATDALFINYWNANSAMLDRYVQLDNIAWRQGDIVFRTEDILYLLARYELTVLPGVLNLAVRDPRRVMQTLAHVDASACAPMMAKAMTEFTSRLARRWLLAYPETAIHGLIAPAVGNPGKDRILAEAALRFLATRGHRESIEKMATTLGREVAASISEILSVDPRSDYVPRKLPSLPIFLKADLHPRPILKNGRKVLPDSAVYTLVRMMSISTHHARTPALDEVIEACNPVSLADFAWSAFDAWRVTKVAGRRSKGDLNYDWVFQALAYLGDDRCARRLTPIIIGWPSSLGTAKALMGLEILAAIGTDTALAQIQVIVRKSKTFSIVDRADELLAVAAGARDLTTEQFEDRLVPDLGLSEDGQRMLNFGQHRFIGSVDETLKPRLTDEAGAVLKALPKPAGDDDKSLAKNATEQWAKFRADLKSVASLQLLRLENAMIEARLWRGDEFQRLLVHHPLLQKSVRSLVWGLFNDSSKLTASFRILPDGGFADANGKPVTMEEASLVGIPHPLILGDKLDAWTRIFAEARQGQAFAQLVRKTYRRTDDAEMNLFGLQGAVVYSKALKGLKAMGWMVLLSGFADIIECYYRYFPSGSADLRTKPGDSLTSPGLISNEQTLEIKLPEGMSDIEFSELIRELLTLKR
jgi:hypothetical protein